MKTNIITETRVLLALVVALASGVAEAKINRVTVTGHAAVVEGDRAATEAAAKRAARREAIEQGGGVAIESNTVVRNFQLMKDEIASRAKGVITDEEWGPLKVDGNAASIELTASVSPEAIDDAVCTIVKASSDPRIAIVFVEKTGDDSQPWVAAQAERGPIEAIFTESFMEKCFTIVEPGVKVTDVAANGDLSQDTINAIIKNSKAQYVLLGKGKIVKADKSRTVMADSKMNAYSIDAQVRLVNAETNVVEAVASANHNNMGISAQHALRAKNKDGRRYVIDEIMDQLFMKIGERWASDLANANKISVTVKGIKNYAAAKDFRAGVESTLKGSTVTQRTLKEGTAEMEVVFEGGADTFAAAIDQKKLGKVKVEVLEVAPGKVVLQVN